MTEFVVSVYEEGDVIGAEVKVSSGDTIESIEIVDAEDLNTLQQSIQNIINNYASKTYLDTTLANNDLSKTINATKLDGHTSNYYATATHEHQYAPISHSDTTGQYGVATDTSYGHVKTINGLTDNSYVSGRALSSYQGKLLDDKTTTIKNEVEARGGFFIYDCSVQRGTQMVIKAYNADGTPMANGTRLIVILKTTRLVKTVQNGQVSETINLEPGIYDFIVHKEADTKSNETGKFIVW